MRHRVIPPATSSATRSTSAEPSAISSAAAERRRELHKVLGDTTRDSLMAVLSASAEPLTAADLADQLGLHPNTVRPHLDRLRSVGLVRREVFRHGDVGRPQHHYTAIAASDPAHAESDRDALSVLADAMVAMARDAGVTADNARASGVVTGTTLAGETATEDGGSVTIDQIADDLGRLGFEPTIRTLDTEGSTEIVFGRCPFGALATDAPDIVCSIHEGLIDGFASGDEAAEILDFVGPSPDADCKVLVKVRDTNTLNSPQMAREHTRSTP